MLPMANTDPSECAVGVDDGAGPSATTEAAVPSLSARRCPTCKQVFSGEARFCPFDADSLIDAPDWNPAADPLIGKTVDGRYEVLSVLGEGGMGTVYQVRHVTLGRRFALKVLRRDLADPEHIARFLQEAKAAAAIGHPNIVAVTDFGELVPSGEDGAPVPYLVMEHLAGITLATLLRTDRAIDPIRLGEILLQCAAGLTAAHAVGVTHRDIKPDNIFLTRNADMEYVKLLDFGVAKMAGTGRLTRAGMVFGTPHYMSPEQAAGHNVDHRADIYALGVILYEGLAGKVPFEADTYMGVLTKHMFATPDPIERVVHDPLSLGPFAPIALRCLAKSPRDRYATMVDVVKALELALAEVRSRTRAAASHSRRFFGKKPSGPDSRRYRTPMVAAVTSIVVAVAVLALAGVRVLKTHRVEAAVLATVGPASAAPPALSSAAGASPAPEMGPAPQDIGWTTPPRATASATAPTDPAAQAATGAPVRAGRSDGRSPHGTRSLAGGKRPGDGSKNASGRDVVDPWRK